MRPLLLALALAPGLAWGQADPAALADIRAEIAALSAEIQALGTLGAEGGGGGAALGGASGLERLAAVEAALGALTAKAEELEFRVNRVVTDGTNRLGDLEFRVCELEEGCDLGALGDTPALGGVDSAAAVPQAQEPVAGPELAVGEQDAFERAEGVLATGDFQGAVDQLEAFVATYPGSPLTARAQVARGRAFEGLDDASGAARAFLDAFSAEPNGESAPDALLGLGRNLGRLGQTPDACVTLAEVATRFPASPLVLDAEAERRTLGCS